jgi:hypothetical protein
MNVMDSQSIEYGFELVSAGLDRLAAEVDSGAAPGASLRERLETALALPQRAYAVCDLAFALNELMQLEACAGEANPRLLEILDYLMVQEKACA